MTRVEYPRNLTTNPDEEETIDALPVTVTQRRMLIGSTVAIVISIALNPLPMIWNSAVEDMENSLTTSKTADFLLFLKLLALAAFVVPARHLIRRIGWSALNQLAFLLIRRLSTGCGPPLRLAVFLIKREANHILRSQEVTIGLLGASRSEIDRMREDPSKAQV